MRKLLLLFCFYFQIVQAQQKLDCRSSTTDWIKDNEINGCTFTPPTINSQYITSIEFGSHIDKNSLSYHCYYVENKICNIDDCKECNEKNVFELMLSDKKFIAPTDETGPVTNCSSTLVNIPDRIPLTLYNPIITTVNSVKYTITNYTVYINRSPSILSTGHTLHPGRVQRTIIKKGKEIFIATMGEGTGKWSNINNSLAPGLWSRVDKKIMDAFKCSTISQFTLFLFDVSGSMNDNNKWASAKQAATSTLDFLFDEAGKNNKIPFVGLMSYSGNCVDNPTTRLLDFSGDKTIIKNAINNNLPRPGGSTPTPQAIQNAEALLKQELQKNNQCEGDLVILTDGQSTCGSIRPPGTFSQAQQKTIYNSCQTGSTNFQMRYQTIGFDIPPGSDAEKDLQYLSSTHNGRYFHAANMTELKKAFEKISRVYIPIENVQSTSKISTADNLSFNKGVDFIKTKNFDTAFFIFKKFNEKYSDDSAGIYNYAEMNEATDQYKVAAKNYTTYLQQNPQVNNRKDIEATIQKMNQYYLEYFNYQKEIVKKDLIFLDGHFRKLMTKQSISLANEFTGFISEKAVQYEKLPNVLGVNDSQVIILCKDIISSFKAAQRRINANAKEWDQDAVPVISVLYLKLEKLNALIENIEAQ